MTAFDPDHYRVLGVPVRASRDEIRAAYRLLAQLYHPDRHPGSALAEDRFKRIAEAYRVVSTAATRVLYDRELMLRRPLRALDDAQAERVLSVLDKVAEVVGKRRPALARPRHGRDQVRALVVSFEDAALGRVVPVDVAEQRVCGACDGHGAKAGTAALACHVCAGRGRINDGTLRRRSQSCAFCEGRGRLVLDACAECAGSGERSERRTEGLPLPPGVRSGTRLRMRGRGERGELGGRDGDLLVDIEVTPHPLFVVDGSHLRCTVPLTLGEAARGVSAVVPTLEGPRRLRITPGAQSGQVFRVAGCGLPDPKRPSGLRGDLFVTLRVVVPRVVQAEALRVLDSLERVCEADSYAEIARYREIVGVDGTLVEE